MSLSSAKAKLDAQGGDPATGYISKQDHKDSYDQLVADTALTGATTAEAVAVSGTTDASSATTGTLKTAGGLGVAKKAYVGTDLAVGGNAAVSGTVAGSGLAGSLLSAATPVINGVAAAGTSAIPSRQDHVHASDTTRAPLASPTFTGTVTIPSGLVLGTVTHTEGSGSPQSVVTAPVGSTYIDTAATTGAIQWMKATGTGNTGWVVQYGDTGWRDVSASLQTGWTGKLYVRRQNGTVTVTTPSSNPLTHSAAAAGTVLTAAPTGFGGDQAAIIACRPASDGAITRPFLWRSGSSCYYYGSTATGQGLLFSGTVLTSESWPSSLPGSAA